MNRNTMRWTARVVAALAAFALAAPAGAQTMITHATNPTPPGKLFVVVGDGWDDLRPVIRAARLADVDPGPPPGDPRVALPADAPTVEVYRIEPNVLTCGLPEGEFGVVAIQAEAKEGAPAAPVTINGARLDWLSADRAAPGEVVRAMGRNLVSLSLYATWDEEGRPSGYGGYADGAATRVTLRPADGGAPREAEIVKASAYDVHFRVPSNLGGGAWDVFVHNGHGGPAGWSAPQRLEVGPAPKWPDEVFDVTKFGAPGNGWDDATMGVVKALAAARENGGGVVYFPPGSYVVKTTLRVPPKTVLRGESRERSWIWFPDAVDHGTRQEGWAVPVGIAGETDFGLENLSVHCVYCRNLVAAPVVDDLSPFIPEDDEDLEAFQSAWHGALDFDKPPARNVFIRNCLVYQTPTYRTNQRRRDDPFSTVAVPSFRNPVTHFSAVCLHAEDVVIEDNLIKGAGCATALFNCQRARVARNELTIGLGAGNLVWGATKGRPAPDRMVFEDNRIRPGSNMLSGGFWVHHGCSRFYVARNDFLMYPTLDTEGILFHGGGLHGVYDVVDAALDSATLAPNHRWIDKNRKPRGGRYLNQIKHILDIESGRMKPDAFKGYTCLVVDGRGLGQMRTVVGNDETTVRLDRPWDLAPAAGSRLALTGYPPMNRLVVVDNNLRDTGPGIKTWGNVYDLVVDGNAQRRAAGLIVDQVAHHYREWSGNFFLQLLHNTVSEGRFYGSANVKYTIPWKGDGWTKGMSGTNYHREPTGVGQLELVFRGNRHETDSGFCFWGRQHEWPDPPSDVGVVLEDNLCVDSTVAIDIGAGVSATLRDNRFRNVETELIALDDSRITIVE